MIMYTPPNSELIRIVAQKNPDFIVDHTIRVVSIAEQLRNQLGGDQRILFPAAFLHDIEFYRGVKGHGKRGADLFRKIFDGRYSPEAIEQIAHCIEAHPVKYAPFPETIEAKCLRDGDRIDSIASFVPQRYLASFKKFGDEELAWQDCMKRIKGWYNSMVTDIGKERFLAIAKDMQNIFPQLTDLEL